MVTGKCGRQFQIFHLYVLYHWPVRELARILRVNAVQVYLAKHSVGAVLKQELKKLAERML
jgi:RNA polymerase sigma-70 factor (ECF subfamily)